MNGDVGRQLAVLRATRGLSQEALAEHLGVSRQAVSNWERSESMPDTGNLLRLAQYYGVTLDELTARRLEPESAAGTQPPLQAHKRAVSRESMAFVLLLAATAVYFAWLAHPLLFSTVDDITEMFGLVPGPALAVVWFIGEVVFLAAPFLVMALAPMRVPRWSIVLPLVALAALALPPLLTSTLGGAPFVEYGGIGGALQTSVVMKADALAVLLACTALAVSRRARSRIELTSTPS